MPHSAVATHCTQYDILGQRIGQDAGKVGWDCRKMEHKAAAFHHHLNDCKTLRRMLKSGVPYSVTFVLIKNVFVGRQQHL